MTLAKYWYACSKYLVIFLYIFMFVSNFANIIMKFQNVLYNTNNIFEKYFCKHWNTFVSHYISSDILRDGWLKSREFASNTVKWVVLGVRPISISPSEAFLPFPPGPSRNVWASPLPSNSHGNYLRRTNSDNTPVLTIFKFMTVCVYLRACFIKVKVNYSIISFLYLFNKVINLTF